MVQAMSAGMVHTQESVIPVEYREVTDHLFVHLLQGNGEAARQELRKLAECLGIEEEYSLFTSYPLGDEKIQKMLLHFRNNLELLIHKTWVEKAEESHKDRLLERIPAFIQVLEVGNYQKALSQFVVILSELAYLFFGAQAHKSDFVEYAFRIDPSIGLFWWYGGALEGLSLEGLDTALLKSLLAIGICFITTF
ncbi:MAG: hypothetical protein WHT84_03910 [Breznakiellaceae bacterium]